MTQTLAIATGFFSATLTAIAFPPSLIGLAAVGALWLYENRNR